MQGRLSTTRLLSTAPAPPAAMIRPQALAPPRYALASTGPSSRYGPQVMRLNGANCSVVTQSQRNASRSAASAMALAVGFPAELCPAEVSTRSRTGASPRCA